MIFIRLVFKDENLHMKHKERVYNGVCNNFDWIDSVSEDSRSSFFDILYDLFEKNNVDPEHCCMFKFIIIAME